MTFRFGFTEAAVLVVAALFTLAILFLPGYDRPPLETVQSGFRGTGMAQVYNPRTEAARVPQNSLPADLVLPQLVTAGPTAAQSYQNIQVLGDLSTAQFLRLMTAITAWVSPEQGCAYCHTAEGFASDELYTKRVSRWMLHMTQAINVDWATHVKGTWDEAREEEGAGVNCWTCHRGNNVPLQVWYPDSTPQSMGLVGYDAGQNHPAPAANGASLPRDPFSPYLLNIDENVSDRINVNSPTALPRGNTASIKDAEHTFSLMIHMSTSLGVNCSYCHNTRAMSSWAQSPPQRTSAWYGIRMVAAINEEYILPTTVALPSYRIGAAGTPALVNCGTCHQGVFKPLYGVNMVDDFPSLNRPNEISREEIEPGLADWEVSMAIGAELKAAATPAATPAAAPATEAPAPAAPAATPEVETPAAPADGATEDPAEPATDAANVTVVPPAQGETPATPAPATTEAAPAATETAPATTETAPAPAAQ